MSNDLNQCIFIGRLGQDPDKRAMPDGTPVASFSLACGWKSKNKEGVEWIPVVCYGKLAEIVGQYLAKGSQVNIIGRFKTDKLDNNGETRYFTKIIADKMQMLGGRQGGAMAGGNNTHGMDAGSAGNDFDQSNQYGGQPMQAAPPTPQAVYAPQQAPQAAESAMSAPGMNILDSDIPF